CRESTSFVADHISRRDRLLEDFVLAGKVGQLPETYPETLPTQIRDHLRRIRKTRRRKLVVALPLRLKPPGIQMYHIARDSILAELCSHVPHLCFRLVGDAAHPQSERPQGRHRTAAR